MYPSQVQAVVDHITYSGGMAIVVFENTEKTQFRLIGQQHLVAPISRFVGEGVLLSIFSQSDWSWRPAADQADV